MSLKSIRGLALTAYTTTFGLQVASGTGPGRPAFRGDFSTRFLRRLLSGFPVSAVGGEVAQRQSKDERTSGTGGDTEDGHAFLCLGGAGFAGFVLRFSQKSLREEEYGDFMQNRVLNPANPAVGTRRLGFGAEFPLQRAYPVL